MKTQDWNELSKTRKIIALVIAFATAILVGLVVADRDHTIKDDDFWLNKAVPVKNSAYVIDDAEKTGPYRDWAIRERGDMFDGDNEPFTNGDASAANMQNLEFKGWAKGEYRDWLNSQAKAKGTTVDKLCCDLPDPEEWWDNFIKETKNGACHLTATNLQQLKCAGEITDQIVLHPSKLIFGDVAWCIGGDALAKGLETGATIRWSKYIGTVGGIDVYAPRFTWLLNAPKTFPYLTAVCLGANYIKRVVD